jgi:hypothetical protein
VWDIVPDASGSILLILTVSLVLALAILGAVWLWYFEPEAINASSRQTEI